MPGPRYTDWTNVHVRGDREAAAEHVPYGRKLLGYLLEQRKSGVKSQEIQRTLQDGTVIRASFIRDTPSIEIHPGPKPGQPGPDTFLAGLVVLPRTYASITAFGAKAETVLAPRNVGTADETWASYFFDSSYGPGGVYGRTPQGKPLFQDGLKYAGNLDWRSTDESLTVSFIGPASRYFPEHELYEPWVFYNGDVIFDASELPAAATNTHTQVLSAAVRTDVGPYLLVCTFEDDHHSGYLRFYIRFYTCALKASKTKDTWFATTGQPVWKAPRLEKCDATLATKVAEIEIPQLDSYFYVPPFHFNQSATQARAIIPLFGTTAHGVSSDVTEFIVDLSDLAMTSTSTTSHGVLSNTITESHIYTDVLYNVVWEPVFAWRETPPGYTTVDGTFPYDNPLHFSSTPVFAPTSGTLFGVGIPLNTTSTKTEQSTLTEYPVAVDFVADTPVYAYMQPRNLTTSTARTGTGAFHSSGSGSANDVVTGSGTGSVSIVTSWTLSAADDADSASSVSSTLSGTMPGLRCPRHAGVGDWLSFQGTQTGSGSITSSSTSTRSGSNSGTGTPPSSVTLVGTFGFTQSMNWDRTTTFYKLWYLDLRYQAAAYTQCVNAEAQTNTAALTDVWPIVATGIPSSQVYTDDWSFATTVVFNGATVNSWSATKPTATTTNTTPALFGSVFSPFWMWCGLDKLFAYGHTDTNVLLWSTGTPTTSASIAEGAFEASAPVPTDWSGEVNPTQAAGFPLPMTATYPTTANVDDELTDDGWQLWTGIDPNIESIVGTWIDSSFTANTGRYQAYRGGWCYSMPKIQGSTPTTRQWQSEISSGESVDTLTGSHGLDLLGEIWPLSRCPFLTSKASP